jgi:predicted deacylase
VPVCVMASGHHLQLPVHVVTGKRSGPTTLISCASHGDELWSAEFCRRLHGYLVRDGHDFSGTMLLAPVLNPPALESGTRNTPVDFHNLNRVFPGSPAGKNWFSDMLARVIAERILPKADIIFDYHGGDGNTVIHYHYTSDPAKSERDRLVHKVALASGAEVLWEHHEARGTLTNHGEALGKLCIVPEYGGGSLLHDRYFEKCYQDLLNMMRVLELAQGEPVPNRARIVVRTGTSVRPSHGGTFIPVCGTGMLGKSVPGGTVLGRVISPYTFAVLDELRAPFEQTELMQVRDRISKVQPGEYAYIIGDGASGYRP